MFGNFIVTHDVIIYESLSETMFQAQLKKSRCNFRKLKASKNLENLEIALRHVVTDNNVQKSCLEYRMRILY